MVNVKAIQKFCLKKCETHTKTRNVKKYKINHTVLKKLILDFCHRDITFTTFTVSTFPCKFS